MTDHAYYRQREDGFDLFVRLTPKSARDGLEGVETTADGRSHVKARVRAVPEDGKANKALIKLLAKELGLPSSRIAIVAGETARLKTVRIEGEAERLEPTLRTLAGKRA